MVTAVYGDGINRQTIGMSIQFIWNDGIEYMKLYKNKKSPIGIYRYAMFVYIPTQFAPGETKAFVDARWGYFERPLMFIE